MLMDGTHGRPISVQTARNHLRAERIKARRPYVVPPLTPWWRQVRLDWMQKHGSNRFGMRRLRRVLFNDESRFCLYPSDERNVPLNLCLRNSKESGNKNTGQQRVTNYIKCPLRVDKDIKSTEHSLSVITTPGYVMDDNEKMVQSWLQHMPRKRKISTEYDPYPKATSSSNARMASSELSMDSSRTGINVKLYNEKLWNIFRKEGTEMVINRSGRLMYPRVEVTVEGLNSGSMYSVEMVVISVDDKYYRYKDNMWLAVGKSDVHHPITSYKHPSSPAMGSNWMKHMLSFGQVKLSNHGGPGKICLQSMHKYMVQIDVIHHDTMDQSYHFTLPGTEFIALTAYLNEKIIDLKISHNPFARAFKNKKFLGKAVDSHHKQKKSRLKSTEVNSVFNDSASSPGNSSTESLKNHSHSLEFDSSGDTVLSTFHSTDSVTYFKSYLDSLKLQACFPIAGGPKQENGKSSSECSPVEACSRRGLKKCESEPQILVMSNV
ncbi:T-box transcription factor TBX5-like [Ylistrum balloti]|uniref:T-box transcription factor TBX5-like n=1 Tax=Ylistrum balloti TaxID=509963 RepID=UPI002905A55B|nr:T-box transcription factor TBX5-like [Ylistrum balloti]